MTWKTTNRSDKCICNEEVYQENVKFNASCKYNDININCLKISAWQLPNSASCWDQPLGEQEDNRNGYRNTYLRCKMGTRSYSVSRFFEENRFHSQLSGDDHQLLGCNVSALIRQTLLPHCTFHCFRWSWWALPTFNGSRLWQGPFCWQTT